MRLKANSNLMDIMKLILEISPSDQDIFLVGGAVRDDLMGRDVHDLDFAMPVDPTPLARKLARHLGVGYFVLDDDRHTARVLYCDSAGENISLDFVKFTGKTLVDDLSNRDFTINAMARSLREANTLIDPLQGQEDIQKRLIRVCSAHALLDDPVRVLRGVRMAVQFEMDYAEGTPDLMRQASKLLARTSLERQCDELIKILESRDPYAGLRDCRRFEIFGTLFPILLAQGSIPASPPHTLPLFEHTLVSVKYYHHILQCLIAPESAPADPWIGYQLLDDLMPFSEELIVYFNSEITPGRSIQGLSLLGALLHDIGKPSTMDVGEHGKVHYFSHELIGADLAHAATKQIRLSNAESDWIHTFVRHHMDLSNWINSQDEISRKGIYRFFKKTGNVSPAILLFSLADSLATYGKDIPQEKWEKKINWTKEILSAWLYEKNSMVMPEPFLNGHELQEEFGLTPGKNIGELLENLIEAQVGGEVLNKDDARDFIAKQIKSLLGM
jgi:tRNA nucleotidyltransferase/poly(A) polymerase